MGSMSGKERTLRALHLEEADRVPCFELLIDPPVAEKIVGTHIMRGWESVGLSPEKGIKIIKETAKSLIKCCKKIGLDAFTLWDFTLISPVKWLDANTYVDAWGAIWQYRPDIDSATPLWVGGTIKNPEDLESLELPDPAEESRFIAYKAALDEAKEDVLVVFGALDVWQTAYCMRGMEGILKDMYLRPAFVKELIERTVKYNFEFGNYCIDMGAEAIVTGDDYAEKHGLLMSPKLFREFLLPSYRRMVRGWKKRNPNLAVIKHTDGNIYPIIDDLIDAGIDALDPIEPQAMNIEVLKDKYHDKLCLCGNVDCGHTLIFGTPEDVKNEAREIIRKASWGGGHLLASSNSIQPGTPVENFRAMTEAARKYGKYPLRE